MCLEIKNKTFKGFLQRKKEEKKTEDFRLWKEGSQEIQTHLPLFALSCAKEKMKSQFFKLFRQAKLFLLQSKTCLQILEIKKKRRKRATQEGLTYHTGQQEVWVQITVPGSPRTLFVLLDESEAIPALTLHTSTSALSNGCQCGASTNTLGTSHSCPLHPEGNRPSGAALTSICIPPLVGVRSLCYSWSPSEYQE